MSNEQSIRDEFESRIRKAVSYGQGIERNRELSSQQQADWIQEQVNLATASPVIRRIQAEAGAEALRSYRTRLMGQSVDRFGIVLPDLHEVLDDLDEEADRIERGETV